MLDFVENWQLQALNPAQVEVYIAEFIASSCKQYPDAL
jgi:hypothetical protein